MWSYLSGLITDKKLVTWRLQEEKCNEQDLKALCLGYQDKRNPSDIVISDIGYLYERVKQQCLWLYSERGQTKATPISLILTI